MNELQDNDILTYISNCESVCISSEGSFFFKKKRKIKSHSSIRELEE
ncbi:hypothetical protein FH5_04424 [Priestia endophytica]|nr:hypothetical protein FH5_04424 [Priestia endophytica]